MGSTGTKRDISAQLQKGFLNLKGEMYWRASKVNLGLYLIFLEMLLVQ